MRFALVETGVDYAGNPGRQRLSQYADRVRIRVLDTRNHRPDRMAGGYVHDGRHHGQPAMLAVFVMRNGQTGGQTLVYPGGIEGPWKAYVIRRREEDAANAAARKARTDRQLYARDLTVRAGALGVDGTSSQGGSTVHVPVAAFARLVELAEKGAAG